MKNSWKKTLSLLLCLVLLAGLFPAAMAEGETCTLTFSVDGGNYLDPITAEKNSEITLPKAVWNDHYYLGWSREYNGEVEYQAGDTLVLTENLRLYAIWRDFQPLGLCAYWEDNGKTSGNTTVPLNGSVTLTVVAGVDQGGLRYEWRRLDYPYTAYSDNDSKTLTLENVNERMTIWCDVYDDYGNNKSVQFELSLDTGLWARAAGSGTNYALQRAGSSVHPPL